MQTIIYILLAFIIAMMVAEIIHLNHENDKLNIRIEKLQAVLIPALARLNKPSAAAAAARPVTAQEIANEGKFRFNTRKSWSEERAELEQANATKEQDMEKRVQEFQQHGY